MLANIPVVRVNSLSTTDALYIKVSLIRWTAPVYFWLMPLSFRHIKVAVIFVFNINPHYIEQSLFSIQVNMTNVWPQKQSDGFLFTMKNVPLRSQQMGLWAGVVRPLLTVTAPFSSTSESNAPITFQNQLICSHLPICIFQFFAFPCFVSTHTVCFALLSLKCAI